MAFAACPARWFLAVTSSYMPLAISLATNSIFTERTSGQTLLKRNATSQKYPLEPLMDVDYVLDSHNYLEKYIEADELVPAPYQKAAEKIIAPSPKAGQAISGASLVTSQQAMKVHEVVPLPFEKAEEKIIAPSSNAKPLALATNLVTSSSGTERALAKKNVLRHNTADFGDDPISQKYPLEPLMDVDYVLDSHNYLEKYIEADELVPAPYQKAAEKIIAPPPKVEQVSTPSLMSSQEDTKTDELVPVPYQKAPGKIMAPSSQAEQAILAASLATSNIGTEHDSVRRNVLKRSATDLGVNWVPQDYPLEPLMDVDYVLDSHNYLEKYVKADELVPDPYQKAAEKIIAPSPKAEQASHS